MRRVDTEERGLQSCFKCFVQHFFTKGGAQLMASVCELADDDLGVPEAIKKAETTLHKQKVKHECMLGPKIVVGGDIQDKQWPAGRGTI